MRAWCITGSRFHRPTSAPQARLIFGSEGRLSSPSFAGDAFKREAAPKTAQRGQRGGWIALAAIDKSPGVVSKPALIFTGYLLAGSTGSLGQFLHYLTNVHPGLLNRFMTRESNTSPTVILTPAKKSTPPHESTISLSIRVSLPPWDPPRVGPLSPGAHRGASHLQGRCSAWSATHDGSSGHQDLARRAGARGASTNFWWHGGDQKKPEPLGWLSREIKTKPGG